MMAEANGPLPTGKQGQIKDGGDRPAATSFSPTVTLAIVGGGRQVRGERTGESK